MLFDDKEDWYRNPEFWSLYKPLMFDPDRMVDTSVECDGILKLADLRPGSAILDLCCGEGRHIIEFAGRGYRATGVDLTESYIENGKNNAAEAGADVRFVRGDVLEFCEPDTYDFAMNFFTSFGYFEDPDDDLRLCSNACRSLKKGGSFLIDTIGKETTALKFRESEWFQRDGFLIMLEYSITDGWTHIENRWLFVNDDPAERTVLHEAVFRHRLYSAVELAGLLTEAGFSEVRFYGGLDGRRYNHKAERMLAVAVK